MVLVTDGEKLQILGAIIKTAVKLKMTGTPTDSFFQSTRTDQNSSTKILPNFMVSN